MSANSSRGPVGDSVLSVQRSNWVHTASRGAFDVYRYAVTLMLYVTDSHQSIQQCKAKYRKTNVCEISSIFQGLTLEHSVM